MNKLKIFLEESFNSLKRWKDFENIHIVLGNESCDLDSTICSIAYGYYLSVNQNLKNTAIFPVVNVSSKEFPIRTEHCSLLKDIDIDLNKLIYRSDIKIDEILTEKRNNVKTYLVDHHVLNKNDDLLKDSVCKIFDHRPIDKGSKWPSNTEIRVELVGSCATLIADELLKVEGILFKDLAYLLYCTIVFDTLAVNPENKKATPLDVETAKKLEDEFGFKEPKQSLFQKIVDLHSDISNLTPDQLLIRDLKFVDNIPIPGLPMLVETFSRLPGVQKSLESMGDKHKANFIVLIGIEAKPDVRRDVGVFMIKDDEKLRKVLLGELKSHEDFKFEETSSGVENLVVFRQKNLEKSRKQIIPIIRSFVDDKMR